MFLLGQLTKVGGIPLAGLTPNYQAGVDAFFQSALGSYSTPANIPTGAAAGTVIAAPTFMMNPGYDDQVAFKAAKAAQAEMLRIATGAGLSSGQLDRLTAGRATPDEVRTMTQALINAQPATMTLINTSAKVWQPLDVRKIMHSHAIGFDCAGYVQQAYLQATGRTRDQLGWKTLENEGLLNLSGNGFRKFASMADLRPGDIIAFNATDANQPGHRTIVFDQRVATADDQSSLLQAAGGASFAGAGTLRVLWMDSSYGSNGWYYRGGVQRQQWFYNGSQWGHLILDMQQAPETANNTPNQAPFLDVQNGLYGPNDVVEGFYRFRADG
jgi:cell wall-associated NlpC family hydrolase